MRTAWVGGMWIVGYLVAPLAFAVLPERRLAGEFAGQLFSVMGWFGLCCGFLLLTECGWRKRRAVWIQREFHLLLAMLFLTLIALLGIQPYLAELKVLAGAGSVMESSVKTRFAVGHAISSGLFLVQSLLGAWLILLPRSSGQD